MKLCHADSDLTSRDASPPIRTLSKTDIQQGAGIAPRRHHFLSYTTTTTLFPPSTTNWDPTPPQHSSPKMISRAAAPSPTTLSRSLRVQGPAARSFATVQDNAPPVRHHGGLQDQDRIFTNLYGHHGADLKSAMKYGDWHRTKDIVLKGHDWVGFNLGCYIVGG